MNYRRCIHVIFCLFMAINLTSQNNPLAEKKRISRDQLLAQEGNGLFQVKRNIKSSYRTEKFVRRAMHYDLNMEALKRKIKQKKYFL